DAAEYGTGEPIAEFWHVFQDPILDQLVADALAANHDLRIAAARMESARQLARQARHDFFPTVTASASYTDSRTSAAQIPSNTGPFDNEVHDGGFDAFWELDIFGRVLHVNEAQRSQYEATQADLAAAQVSVAAELARSYFVLRGFQELLGVAMANIDN